MLLSLNDVRSTDRTMKIFQFNRSLLCATNCSFRTISEAEKAFFPLFTLSTDTMITNEIKHQQSVFCMNVFNERCSLNPFKVNSELNVSVF